jgi:uncharacterized protein (TIRG00374 family)
MNRRAPVRQQRTPDLVSSAVDGSLIARIPLRSWIYATFLAAALIAALGGARLADIDVADGLWDGAGALSDGAARIRWLFVPVIGILTVLHYLTSAIGVRATASGASTSAARLGLWEITTTQLAGAAANRLAPAGLGSAAVTCRYLTRRGVPACAATTTVAVVGLIRGLAKLTLVALVIALWSGLGHAITPVVQLGRTVTSHSAILLPVAIAAGCAVLLLVVAALYWRRRQAHQRIGAAIMGVLGSLRLLLKRPHYLLASFAAAALGELLFALAFVVSVTAIPGAERAPLGPLFAVYLLGATAGAAIPVPTGVGSMEAALIAALATVHVPAAQAAQGVLLFRVMTFWAPVPAGVLSTRWLRRRGGL